MRIGHGYDVHKLVKDRSLILGGVKIPFELGLLGHSDADVLTHAVMDALLGAASMGDIGKLFPDNDPNFKDADSLKLLRIVCEKVKENGFKIENIDSTIVVQKPKLSTYIPQIRENIAKVCNLDLSKVSVKATTEENLGFTGDGLGIKAYAVCLLSRID